METKTRIENLAVGESGYVLAGTLHTKDQRFYLHSGHLVSPDYNRRVSCLFVTRTDEGYIVDIKGAVDKLGQPNERDWVGNGRNTGYGHPEVFRVVDGEKVVYQKPAPVTDVDTIGTATTRQRLVRELKGDEVGYASAGVIYKLDDGYRIRTDLPVYAQPTGSAVVQVCRAATGWQADIGKIDVRKRVFANVGYGANSHEKVKVLDGGVEVKLPVAA